MPLKPSTNSNANLCETHFLGWDQPLLPQAVTFLCDQFGQDGSLDLSGVICVLPAARGTHRLAELLRSEAKSRELEFWPPTILTTGELAENLYTRTQQVATDFEQTLAWSDVLRAINPTELAPLLPTLPPSDSLTAWLELAGTLRRLNSELATSCLSFSDVVDSAETDAERRRWKLLDRLHGEYLSVLRDADVLDPNWARRKAVDESACKVDRQVVLVGTSDLTDILLAMLAGVAENTTALIAAPVSEAFRFDSFGCVDTEAWLKHELPLKDDQLVSAGDVTDQANAVAETLVDYATEFAADQVTVGITDEAQVGPIELQLRGCGVTTHRELGWSVSETAIGRLFNLTATFLQRGTWQSLAALVRHADIHAYITQLVDQKAQQNEKFPSDWLLNLDNLLSNHFPLLVADPLPPIAQERFPAAAFVAESILELMREFGDANAKTVEVHSISQWSEIISRWLKTIYGARFADDSAKATTPDSAAGASRTQKAIGAIHGLLKQFHGLNAQLDVSVAGSVAFEMIAARMGELRITNRPTARDVEILGWLDLALDDAPAMVVMGLNHPFVPQAVTSDPFLPGTLRTRLSMADNDRRYARDIYAMHLLLSTRSAIRFVVGKNGADGSPTPPSRLIAAAPAADSARRVRQLLGKDRPRVIVQHRWDAGENKTELPIPILDGLGAEVKRLSVTSFSSYLTCPYRFYLRNILHLRPLDDATGELAANQFGDLVHNTLEAFGESPDKDLTDESKIEASLIQHLHEYAQAHYGSGAAMSVQLQVKQAEQRLKIFAKQQAMRIAEGWVIKQTEASVQEVDTPTSKAANIIVDGRKMGIRGRFDRIDHHPDTNRWAILDYKTHGHLPEKKHLKRKDGKEQWVDLQLPLYRQLIPFLGIEADPVDVQLGYFNVSEKESETKVNIAQFTESQMKAADDLIHQVIRDIWANRFEPTEQRVLYDDYESILQMRVPQRMLNQAELAETIPLEEMV